METSALRSRDNAASLSSKVESLSRVDPGLLFGIKDVEDLKHKNLGGGKNGTHLAIRADLADLSRLDEEVEKVQPTHKEAPAKIVPAPVEKVIHHDWEIDVSKLVLKTKIASGTYGTVHKGVYNGKEVAVKLLDWGEDDTMSRGQLLELRKAFKQEVDVWSKLEHPNVCQFLGASLGGVEGFAIPSFAQDAAKGEMQVSGNICCVLVEFMPAGTLKDYLIKNYRSKLPLKMVLKLALDFARGLQYLHSKRIIHRDVKTENVLMDNKKVVKIADFGVARLEAANPKDMTGETGTLGYMAPEVLQAQPYNHKADVYSFGICLNEIYKADMPFPGNLNFSQMKAVVTSGMRPEIPGRCPSELATIMKRCWDGNPIKRPNMTEVVKLLEAVDVTKGKAMMPLDDIPRQGGCFCF